MSSRFVFFELIIYYPILTFLFLVSQETTITNNQNFPISNQFEEENFGNQDEINEMEKELERKMPVLKNIDMRDKLGEGNFGVVMYGIWENQEIAMKSIGLNKIKSLIKEAKDRKSTR